EGKANAATYPKLVNQLNEQNLNNIAAQDPRLSLAIHEGKKNFPIGTATYEEADRLGKIWVGEGARQTSGGGWLSRDGTRQYRPPTEKKSQFATTGIQANFETYTIDSNEKRNKIKNGH
ncbi:TPA: septum formation inhibitor Maf, partial [Neisseria gonorrhoeae]